MNLADLEQQLPNGFHDAEVSRISIDFLARNATLELEIWIGDMACPPEDGREVYRAARLELLGLAYLAMEPPDPNYGYLKERQPGPLDIDLSYVLSAEGHPLTQPGEFNARFFVYPWNSFIELSAVDARLTWTFEAYDRAK